MRAGTWKVDELAKKTGLSVRALHYYDEIGLLSPSRRTEVGHRLYDAGDVVRLQQIRSLKYLGFGLEEIRAWLPRPGHSAQRVVELHLARLREQIELQQKLCACLEAVAVRLPPKEEASAGKFVETIMEVVEMAESREILHPRTTGGAEAEEARRDGEWHGPVERAGAAPRPTLDGAGPGVHRWRP